MAIRVVIVDDHPVVRGGLAGALAAVDDIDAVGTAGSIAEARDVLTEINADVALFDIRLPDGLVFELVSEVSGALGVVLYSSFDVDQYVAEAVRRGARGFVLKTAPLADLVATIRRVAAGGYAISTRQLERSRHAITLTSRERDLVRLVVDGRSNKAIADALGLAPNSIERYLSRLYVRAGVHGRVELVVRAEREGWLEPN